MITTVKKNYVKHREIKILLNIKKIITEFLKQKSYSHQRKVFIRNHHCSSDTNKGQGVVAVKRIP